jgi:hypothetical protein
VSSADQRKSSADQTPRSREEDVGGLPKIPPAGHLLDKGQRRQFGRNGCDGSREANARELNPDIRCLLRKRDVRSRTGRNLITNHPKLFAKHPESFTKHPESFTKHRESFAKHRESFANDSFGERRRKSLEGLDKSPERPSVDFHINRNVGVPS